MVTTLVLVSCASAVTEYESEEATAPPAAEQEVVTEGEEEEEAAPPQPAAEQEVVTEEEETADSMPTSIPRGTVDPNITVDIYKADKAYAGTTLLTDNINPDEQKIIEVNMLGEIVWEYIVPDNLGKPGDVEWLPNDNILFQTGTGVYEIDRSGKIVWSYLTDKISHDADRLPNGNTIFVWGMGDKKTDAQVTEVNPDGDIVWEWYARDHFNEPPYSTIDNAGWTHTNAVTRMANGNTLISPRNFGLLVEVDVEGKVVRTIGGGVIFDDGALMRPNAIKAYENADPFSAHEPEILPNGNILVVSQFTPHRAIEMVPETGEVVWEYPVLDPDNWPVRDADRLPNGNTLITGTTKIIEVTAEGEIVWQLSQKGVTGSTPEGVNSGLYKTERISIRK